MNMITIVKKVDISLCAGDDSSATSELSSFATCGSGQGCRISTTKTSKELDGETPIKKQSRIREHQGFGCPCGLGRRGCRGHQGGNTYGHGRGHSRQGGRGSVHKTSGG